MVDASQKSRRQKLSPNFKIGLLIIACLGCFELHFAGRLSSSSLDDISVTPPFSLSSSPEIPGSSCTAATVVHTSVKDVCRCLSAQMWSSTSSPNAIVADFWQSPRFQTILRNVTDEGISKCWNWEGALDNFDKVAFRNATNRMLQELTGYSSLKRALKTRPHPFEVERIAEIILQRLASNHNPPLKIVVLGGSVAQGIDSRTNSLGLSIKGKERMKACAWASQLESLLNQLFRNVFGNNNKQSNSSSPFQKVVVVNNLATGGSDSDIGNALLESNVLVDKTKTADIIIGSFAANDMQAPKGVARDRLYVSMQKFVRLAKSQRPCSDLPLVIQFDDVLSEQLASSRVKNRLRYAREMAETANWGSVMSVSYPDVIRNILYAHPDEHNIFHDRQLHPGYTTHTGFAWTLAYALLEVMLDACHASSLPNHNATVEPRAGYPLPILHDELKADEVPALWQQEAEKHARMCQEAAANNNSNTVEIKCIYKWLAAFNAQRTAKDVHNAVSRVATNIQGWEAKGNPIQKPRRTWIASGGLNSTFTIQFDDIPTPINRIMVMYIKSYGKKWKSSELEIIVEGKGVGTTTLWKELERVRLSGVHDSQTSVNYAHYIELGKHNLQVGSSVRATFTLVGGKVFQINSMAACYSPMSLL